MIIRNGPSQIPMRAVVRPLLNPAFWVFLALFAAPLSSVFEFPQEPAPHREELEQKIAPMYASSPGHSVFGEYVGAHWCPPCMDSASPSLSNLKASNPDEFTFVSFFESSSGGWPNDAPISRMNHIMAASSGYPTFSFADQQSGSCYKVGAAGTNYYDSDFSNGGCMSSDSADFSLEMSMSLNSTSEEVTIDFEATYTGSQSTIDVYIYGAVTEHIGADSYDNGVRPHHNWRSWLLDSTDTGFQQVTMFKDVTFEHSWTAPLSLVRAAAGYTQWENFWPVIALMDGPHTSYNTFYAAIDPEMGPLIDVGITEFEVDNVNQNPGFVPGDTLELSIEVVNNGVEQYTEGGDIGVYVISGSDELYIGGEPIGNLGISGTQSMELQFDTTGIEMVASGVTTFRAKLTDMGSDRNSTNNMEDTVAYHDLPPTPSQPAAIGSTTFERGDAVQFESSALANDLIDDMTTMTPTMQTKSGTSDWSGSWVSNSELVGSGGNALYVHTIQTPPTADSGSYSIRVMWIDSSGQQSEWLEVQDAFELSNALPRVLSADDAGFAGTPTVKIDTLESVSLSGLVRDAETPLSMLSIESNDPEFKGWNAATATISVEFDTIENDPQGNPIPQGIFVSIDDGEDVNNGMLLFNVIENGAPRWSPVPTQPVFEGGSASTSLTSFLTDSDDEGNLLPASGLSLSIVSNSDSELLDVYIEGHSITAITVDDDSHGVAEVVVRADDGSKSSDTSVIFFVINVNDAPTIDLSGLGEVTLKSNEQHSIDTLPLMSDIDDPSDEIWMDVVTEVPGAVQYDYVNGVMTMQWEEPGTHEVALTLIDSHGDWSVSQFTVTILDSKPLTWSTDFEAGDLQPQVDGLSVGEDPTVTIVNVGPLELSEIRTTWTICNSIVGVCHTAGSSSDLGPFVAAPISGNGMAVGDYLTLYVRALDADGWDRESTETLKLITTSVQTPEQPEEPVPEEEENEQQQESGTQSSDSGLSALQIVAAILVLIVFIGGGTLVGLYMSGSIGSRSQESSKPPYEGAPTIDFEQAAPEPEPEPSTTDFEQAAPEPSPASPGHPPVPEEGLPPGWTMEQWQYYGEEWLKRNQ